MNNDGWSFATAPPPIWSTCEDDKLLTVVNLLVTGSQLRMNLSRVFLGKSINELNARFNALKAAAAAEEPWTKDDDDLLTNYILNFPQENGTEWWINLYNCFPSKTWEKVNTMYQTLMNENAAAAAADLAMPDSQPERIEQIPNFVSDQTLLPLPFSEASSSCYNNYGYGIQILNTETATAVNSVLQNHEPGLMDNVTNNPLPLALPVSDDNSNGYRNLNATNGYFPMYSTNQQFQGIQPYNSYFGEENQNQNPNPNPNPNPNCFGNQTFTFTAVEAPNHPYLNPIQYVNNSEDNNNMVAFPSNQVTHPNFNTGYFTSYPSTQQSSPWLPHVTESSASTSLLNWPNNNNNNNNNHNSNNLQLLRYNYRNPKGNNLRRRMKAGRGCYWSMEEHRAFLSGVANCSWGDWRSISRKYVPTKTPAQIASHAQKFQLRHNGPNTATKKRKSIHDITLTSEGDRTILPPRLRQN